MFHVNVEFFRCEGHTLTSRYSCDRGFLFSMVTQGCISSSKVTCIKPHCATSGSGFYIIPGTSCRAYYHCDNGVRTDYLCPLATIYDRHKQVREIMFQLNRVNISRILGRGMEVMNHRVMTKKGKDDWRDWRKSKETSVALAGVGWDSNPVYLNTNAHISVLWSLQYNTLSKIIMIYSSPYEGSGWQPVSRLNYLVPSTLTWATKVSRSIKFIK